MTEQSVRERIVDVLEYMPDSDYPYSDYKDQVGEVAARIVAIIREAMLAPSTVKAAHKGVPPPCQIERVLTNALNEVFGTE